MYGMNKNPLNGGLAEVPCTEPNGREVPEQVDQIEKALCFTEDSLNELFRRLEGCIRPEPVEPKGAQLISVATCTAYGSRLRDAGQRIGALGGFIQDLLRRLEI